MTGFEKLDGLLQQKQGVLQISEVVAAGVSKSYFYEYVKSRGLVQASRGIYLAEDTWADPMNLLQRRFGQAIFSHNTALFLHGMTDREPVRYTVTVRSGYNPTKLTATGVKAYTVKKQLHELGAERIRTPFGFEVTTYDMERTVCDMVRSRSTIEAQTYQDAIKQYCRRKEKNLRRLMQYAQVFHVEKIVRQYPEVLL